MNFEYYLNLHKSGNLIEAEKGYRTLLKKKINSDIFTGLALICKKTKREKESIKFFKKAIHINSHDKLALNNLGLIFLKNKEYKLAKKYFTRALKLSKNAKTYFYLGLIYAESNFDKAIYCYKESIKIDNSSKALCNVGNLLYLKGEVKEAEKFTKLAIKKNPYMDVAYNNLGLINLANGQIKKGRLNFIKSIKVNKNNFRAHYNLSSLNDYSSEDKHLKELLSLLKSSQINEEKNYLLFALGKAFEDREEFKKSFNYFSLANSIRRKTYEYSIKKEEKLFDNIKKILNSERIKKNKKYGYYTDLPIFIVGMPRSGTSLIEQVLSSHSKVFGAGENNLLDDVIHKYFFNKNNLINPKLINKKNLYNAGLEYIKKIKTKSKSKSKQFIINKLPLNFRWIGLINLILPEAKIILCKRKPLDTCLSIFQQNFPIRGNEYSFNLVEIGKYHNLYIDCIKHWKKINKKMFYEVSYENFVKDQKKETKQLLKYCLLNWDEKCLEFYKTKRLVSTSSSLEVRKKIYSVSINKSDRYKRELKEIKKILY